MAPSYNDLNGILRGYKLTVQSLGSNKSMIDLSPDITEYLIKHLTPSTSYEVSVLAYTIGDGPKSIHLLATTNPSDICKFISDYTLFGLYSFINPQRACARGLQ